jgi:transposase
MDARRAKAEQILATWKIVRQGDIFFVPSQSGGPRYSVMVEGGEWSCSCADFEERRLPCKHVLAAQRWEECVRDGKRFPKAEEVEAPPKRKTYPQQWSLYNAAQTAEKDLFQSLLSDLCATVPQPAPKGGRKGGRPALPLSDELFAAVFKVYSLLSARRFACDLEEAHRRGHIGCVPHLNSVLRGLDNPEATPVLFDLIRQSALPLREVETDFAVDSSGFMTSRYVRWFDQKYGTVKSSAEWVKVHILCGVKTNVVVAVDILDKRAHDSPQLPTLVEAAAKGFRIAEVSADKAYAAGSNFEAVAKHGGALYASFKSNTTGGVGGLFEKMYHLFCLNREEYLRHYHKRSNVESTFSMVKRKFGDSLRSKTDTAMVNEALAKLLCHNLCCLVSAWFELGIEPTFGGAGLSGPSARILRFPTRM